MSGNSIFASKKFKTIMKFVYGWGGAVVIVGALFKILHIPGPMLTIGLLVEAAIFVLSAFEPLHEDPDWSLVYPELAIGHADVGHGELGEGEDVISDDVSVVEQLDNMLADAKIEPDLIESLGTGLKNLSKGAGQMGDLTGATAANDELVTNMKNASGKVGELSDAYNTASESVLGKVGELSNAYDSASEAVLGKVGELSDAYDTAAESVLGLVGDKDNGAQMGEQIQKVSGNLAALNNVYEMQLKGASEHLQVTEQMYSGINELMANLHGSLDDTKKYKETMSELSGNLSALNTVYGNMLSAMNVGRD
jgi:methyl-accepting chemotaxis protein